MLTVQRLASLLSSAQLAHHEYEQRIGHVDHGWPDWYASYIVTRLAEDAYTAEDRGEDQTNEDVSL